MTTLLVFVRLLLKEWQAIVTGSILAVLLAVQPYTSWPTPTRRVFWVCLILASYVAAFKVWKNTWEELAHSKDVIASFQNNEMPQLTFWAGWPDHSAANRPTGLYVRNESRVAIPRLALRSLRLGLHTVDFEVQNDLMPDHDRQINYRISGAQMGSEDLLDALMIFKPSEIAPIPFALNVDVTKSNGQVRPMRFTLTYAPLHNPARDPHAVETERCLVFERA